MAVDKIKALKMENPSSGGTQTDPFPTETNPLQDYIAAKGLAFENNDLRLIDLDGSGNLQFIDATELVYVPLWKLRYALYTVFNNTGKSFTTTDVENALNQLRKQIVWDSSTTATTLNGSTVLTVSSNSQQFITGTQTGHSFTLPNATTLFIGWKFQFANQSTQSVSIKDNVGTVLTVIPSLASADFTLQLNPSAAGTWVYTANFTGVASGILNYNITTTTTFTTTSGSDVVVTGFTVTPQAGTYAVWLNGEIQDSNATAQMSFSIYKGGVVITDSIRDIQSYGASKAGMMNTMTITSVNGSQAVDLRVKTSAGTLSVLQRSLLLIRLG